MVWGALQLKYTLHTYYMELMHILSVFKNTAENIGIQVYSQYKKCKSGTA
jgi:hypothetical protein